MKCWAWNRPKKKGIVREVRDSQHRSPMERGGGALELVLCFRAAISAANESRRARVAVGSDSVGWFLCVRMVEQCESYRSRFRCNIWNSDSRRSRRAFWLERRAMRTSVEKASLGPSCVRETPKGAVRGTVLCINGRRSTSNFPFSQS